ncbi:MarR family transcriptional regulator [Rhodobacteraceae bacterium CCMM004]|nr:MarR family transcriptional regulator [Rhodobacteraceae bacterium CCMM004]
MTDPPDHLGWDLARAAAAWQRRFVAAMMAQGWPVFAEARAAILPHIGRSGTPQAALAQALGMSKQAVQKHLDALERDGLIRRTAMDDGRQRRVAFTEAGAAMIRDADRVKAALDADIVRGLGAERSNALRATLKAAAESLEGRQLG